MPAAEPLHVAGGRGEAAAGSDALLSQTGLGWVLAASPRCFKPGGTSLGQVEGSFLGGLKERLEGPSQDLGPEHF